MKTLPDVGTGVPVPIFCVLQRELPVSMAIVL